MRTQNIAWCPENLPFHFPSLFILIGIIFHVLILCGDQQQSYFLCTLTGIFCLQIAKLNKVHCIITLNQNILV